MEVIDTHSHLFVDEFKDDLPEVISRAKEAGVSRIFMPNIDHSTIRPMLEVASLYKGYCFPMIGLHPTSVDDDYKVHLSEMEQMLGVENPFVGIGEVGLDFYWDRSFRRQQEAAFDIQLNWALEHRLPLVIHSREAFESVYALMSPYIKVERLCGIFHSFTGTLEEALRLLEFKQFKLGINGVVTFKKSLLPAVLKSVPTDRIVLETDSPYLAPVPYRGKRNESAFVKNVLQKMTEIYGLPPEILAQETTQNALQVFGSPELPEKDFKVY